MSNNIYNILGKLNSLEPKQPEQKPAQPIYESVDARGSIIAGVKDIEQKLREQFEATKEERETLKTKGGTIYKGGTYGTSFDVGDDGKKKVKHVPKKGQKGRPKKDAGETGAKYDTPKGDIFGRTTGAVPKGKKGTVVKGKANVDTVDEELDEMTNPFAIGMAQAKKEVGLGKAKATGLPKKVVAKGHEIGKAIKRSMNESISLRESPGTLAHIINKYKHEVKRFINGDELDHDLYEALFDYYMDAGEMPYGTMKGRTGDPFEWVTERFDRDVRDYVDVPNPATQPQGFMDKAKALGHGSDEDMINDLRRKTMGEDAELNELAKLAGLKVSEGAKPDFLDVNKDGDEEEPMKKALKDKEEVDEQIEECMSPLAGGAAEMQQAEQQKGRMSVNTSADSEGHKTVTITADGEEAEKLAQLLALAGIGSHQAPQHAEQAAIVVAQEAKEYGNTEVEEPEDVANTPEPEVHGMHRAETTGLANTSDDLHKQKDQHADAAAKGDNPLTKKEKAVENFNPIESLGAKLMAEYQSIKLQK